MARKTTLDEAIAQAAANEVASVPRRVRPTSKKGRPSLYTPAAEDRVYGPTELAELTGYTRDAIHKMEEYGLTRAPGDKGFTLPGFIRFLEGRARAAGRMEADPSNVLEAEQLRKLKAEADMKEDQRDLQRKRLIEVELAVAIYEDDTAYVAAHLRNLGARLMNPLSTIDDAAKICSLIDAEVLRALNNLNSDHVDPNSKDAHPLIGGVMIEGRA